MALKGTVPEDPYEIGFGKASVVREGSDIAVEALALMVHRALPAAEQLTADGVSVEIVDPRTVSPLDTETILSHGSKASTPSPNRLLRKKSALRVARAPPRFRAIQPEASSPALY